MSSPSSSDHLPTQDELDLLHYQPRIDRPVKVKLSEFERNERLRHVIFSGQFSVDMLEDLAGTATRFACCRKTARGKNFSSTS